MRRVEVMQEKIEDTTGAATAFLFRCNGFFPQRSQRSQDNHCVCVCVCVYVCVCVCVTRLKRRKTSTSRGTGADLPIQSNEAMASQWKGGLINHLYLLH